MAAIVETESLTKSYPSLTALENCTIQVELGDVFGLLGPNGAGKTTLLRLIMGFLKPTSGTARFGKLDCYHDRVAVHHQLSYLPGDARLFRTMRGKQVLKFFSQIRKSASFEKALQVADRLELDLSRWVGFMSTGMRQKLALSACFASETALLILDEPTANLDPNVRGEVIKMVAEARDRGSTVIFSSHVLSEVEEVCDQVAILRKGKLVHTQSMHILKRQHRIRSKLKGEIGSIPESLKNELEIHTLPDGELQIETPGELSTILKWLADQPLEDVRIEPVGLRAVYDHFHSEYNGK